MIIFYIYFILSLLLTYFISSNTLKFANKINLIDNPKNSKNKIHNITTPKIGGIMILILILNYLLYDLSLGKVKNSDIIMFLFFFIFFFIGLLDDYLNITPLKRIILYSLSIYIFSKINNDLLVTSFYSETFNIKISFNKLSLCFSIFCIITLLNALNMFDGLNGSLIIYSSCVLVILFLITLNPFIFVVIISLMICLYLNLKNKTFLGNNGSSLLGSILAYLIIDTSKSFEFYMSAEHILIIFLLPSMDLIRLFVVRIFNKKNPFYGDLNHFHHIVMFKYKNTIWIFSLIIFIFLSYGLSIVIEPIIVLIVSSTLYFALIYKNKNLIN